MNIYNITISEYDYDEYVGFIITSSSPKKAIELAKIETIGEEYAQWRNGYTIEKIGKTTSKKHDKSQIILENFNAG